MLWLEPTILLEAAKIAGAEFENVREASLSFVAAVREYQAELKRPWLSFEHVPGDPPLFLLLIAAQILAATKMADDPDGAFTARAYYAQLENIVGEKAMGANFAAEYGEHHQRLWRTVLIKWVAHLRCTIELPTDRGGAGRHVCLPKSQALLRGADIQRLPSFYRTCKYKTGKHYPLSRIKIDLIRLKDSQVAFPKPWPRRVLNDPLKFPLACKQIHAALRDWDGRWELPSSRWSKSRSGSGNTKHSVPRSNWWFAVNIKKSRFITRFGQSFSSSKIVQPLKVSMQLQELGENENQMRLSNGLLVGSFDFDDRAYRQVDFLEPGDKFLLGAHKSNLEAVERLDKLVRCNAMVKKCDWIEMPSAPRDCKFVTGKLADPFPSNNEVAEAWHRLLRSPTPRLILSGGLRLGRKQHWVVGAGPFIKILGEKLPLSIRVDGKSFPVPSRVFKCDLLSKHGLHQVETEVDGHTLNCVVRVGHPQEKEIQDPQFGWCLSNDVPVWGEVGEGLPWVFGGVGQNLPSRVTPRNSFQLESIRRIAFAKKRLPLNGMLFSQDLPQETSNLLSLLSYNPLDSKDESYN